MSRKPLSIMSAEARFLRLPTWGAGLYYWRGREITIEAQPEQAIWMDGEYHGSSPVTAQIIPARWQLSCRKLTISSGGLHKVKVVTVGCVAGGAFFENTHNPRFGISLF